MHRWLFWELKLKFLLLSFEFWILIRIQRKWLEIFTRYIKVYVHALACDIIEAFKSHHLSFYEVFFSILEYSLNFQDEQFRILRLYMYLKMYVKSRKPFHLLTSMECTSSCLCEYMQWLNLSWLNMFLWKSSCTGISEWLIFNQPDINTH